jgi:uncharacterized protein YdhG (YjbR/CyaY superfamily)
MPTKPTSDAASVDAYILTHPPAVQGLLQDIRHTIRTSAPLASEKISYGMPTFFQGRVLVHIGAFKDHIGLYPPVREPHLQARAAPYQGEKGNLKFPLDQPIPHDLIADIVKARAEAATAKRKAPP